MGVFFECTLIPKGPNCIFWQHRNSVSSQRMEFLILFGYNFNRTLEHVPKEYL